MQSLARNVYTDVVAQSRAGAFLAFRLRDPEAPNPFVVVHRGTGAVVDGGLAVTTKRYPPTEFKTPPVAVATEEQARILAQAAEDALMQQLDQSSDTPGELKMEDPRLIYALKNGLLTALDRIDGYEPIPHLDTPPEVVEVRELASGDRVEIELPGSALGSLYGRYRKIRFTGWLGPELDSDRRRTSMVDMQISGLVGNEFELLSTEPGWSFGISLPATVKRQPGEERQDLIAEQDKMPIGDLKTGDRFAYRELGYEFLCHEGEGTRIRVIAIAVGDDSVVSLHVLRNRQVLRVRPDNRPRRGWPSWKPCWPRRTILPMIKT